MVWKKHKQWVILTDHVLQDFKMKKKDIIQLVKKTIKEVGQYQFGNRQGPSSFRTSITAPAGEDSYTGKNEYPFTVKPKRTSTGMMEEEYTAKDQWSDFSNEEKAEVLDDLGKDGYIILQQGYTEYDEVLDDIMKGDNETFDAAILGTPLNEEFTSAEQFFNKMSDEEKKEVTSKWTVDGADENIIKSYKEVLNWLRTYVKPTKDLPSDESQKVLDQTIMDYVKEKQLKEMHDFEKKYGDKIDADNFKNNPKLQPGKTVKYLGTSRKIVKNNGFVLTLDNGTTVNLGQFNKQGAIKEKDMKEALKVSKNTDKSKSAELAKQIGTTVTAVQAAIDAAKTTGQDQTVAEDEMNEFLDENPNEISYDDAKKKGLDNPDKADISKDKDISDYELKRGMAIQKVMDDQEKNEGHMELTNDIGKDDYVDDEGRMAKSQLYKAGKYAMKLHDMLDDMEQLPAWVQAKLTKASDYMSVVYHYLDYEFARRDGNLMEHVDKHKKRATLMEGAMKKFFEMFDEGMTDEEVVLDYAQKGTQVPETFVGKARKQYEGLKRMKLELEMSEKEYKNSASKMVSNAEEGMESSMEEKKLASGLFKENNNKTKTK